MLSFGKPSACKNNFGTEKTQIGSLPRMMTKMLSFGKPSTCKNNLGGRDNTNRQSAKDKDTRTQFRQAQDLKTFLGKKTQNRQSAKHEVTKNQLRQAQHL